MTPVGVSENCSRLLETRQPMRYSARYYMSPQKESRNTGKKNKKKTVAGIIQITRKGVGYLAWPDRNTDKDIEIATKDLHGALNADTVEVTLTKVFPRPKGEVHTIVQRAKTEFVGTLTKNGDVWYVLPSDPKMYRPILVSAVSQEAKEGMKALVRLISFDGTTDHKGEVLQILGESGEHRVTMNELVLEQGFSVQFHLEVEREAKKIQKN